MDNWTELRLWAIEARARDRLAIHVSDFIYSHGEEKEAAFAAMEYERWFAECCRMAMAGSDSGRKTRVSGSDSGSHF